MGAPKEVAPPRVQQALRPPLLLLLWLWHQLLLLLLLISPLTITMRIS